MNWLVWIIFGALAGWIASIIMKRNRKMGAIANIVVGIAGAFIGGYIMNFFGDAVTVPQVAVVRRPVGDVVYVISDSKAEGRPVRRGLRSGTTVEIIEGQKPGEVVAVDGAGFLTQGGRVEVAGGRS